MEPFSVEEASNITGARIIAVGVGGGGGNMIGHMLKEGVNGIEMMLINTDAQALDENSAASKIQIGAKLTKGLGAGMKPEVGRASAEENEIEIKEALTGADIVFISVGLGGGTGTGAAPVVARIAKEVGALTISVVTKPFKFEGRKRSKLAEAGLEELKNESDSIVVIPNDKLISTIDKKMGIKDSFKIVDSILAEAVSGTSGVILSSGENDINLDFADLKTVMSHRGMALMGMGESQGEKSAYEAIKAAIESPLLDNISINGAMGILVHFKMHPDFSMIELSEAMDVIDDSAHEDADVIWGTSTDHDMPEDYIKITLVATGFERELANNKDFVSETPIATKAKAEVKQQTPTTVKPTVIRPKLVVGGNLDHDYLDLPAYMRHQQD